MRLILTAGAALAALTVAAYAHPETRAFFVRGGDHPSADANSDGWLSRDEASAAYTRAFQGLDSNSDGRIDDDDHKDFEVSVHGDFDEADCTQTVEPHEGGDRNEQRITVICSDDNGGTRREVRRLTVMNAEDMDDRERARIEREIARAEREAEHAERDAERAAREAERLAEDAERLAEEIERRVERHVVVLAGEGGEWASLAPLAPMPPVPGVAPTPPVPPTPFLMMQSSEADRNGDGALSREEFVAQQLRYFDANDADGDGRIRLETPPEPPTPPAPPRP